MTRTNSLPPLTAHTPGPWEDNGIGLIFGQASGNAEEAPFIADVCKDGPGGFYSDEEQANARLIAAAPELLTALEGCLFALDENAEGFGPSKAQAMTAARAAIARATEEGRPA
jgi:hypothetical protein